MPNVRCLADAEIEILQDYVRNGGKLLATFATSLCDASGKERPDLGMAELLGCTYVGEKAKTRKDCYQYILQPDHPLVQPDSAGTELLINAGYTLLCKTRPGAQVICTHVPTVHNQPPEKAWVAQWSVEHPTVVENRYGAGKVLYFTNQPDQLSQEIGHPDLRNLLARGIRYLAGAAIPLESNAPGSVHIGLTQSTENPGQYVLSLVNTSSGPGRPVQELIPVRDIEVKLRLPQASLVAWEALRAQGACTVQREGQTLLVQVEKLEDFCAIAIEMGV